MPTEHHDNLIYRLIGRRVRELREGQLTQEELADIVSVSRTSITNLEKGRQRVPLHQLLRIADALDVELADLIPSRGELGLGDAGQHVADDMNVVGDLTPATRTVLSRYTTKEVPDG